MSLRRWKTERAVVNFLINNGGHEAVLAKHECLGGQGLLQYIITTGKGNGASFITHLRYLARRRRTFPVHDSLQHHRDSLTYISKHDS